MTQQDLDASTPPASTPRAGAWALRGLVLAAAVCIGGLATYAVTAPSALAASVVAGIDGAPLMQHLHGHSHAQLHAHFEQVLARAGTNEAQRQQIDAIVAAAMRAEHADMARYHASLGQMKGLLAAPRIDVAGVEQVRLQQDELLLETNRRFTETLLRAAQVLTPAQRQAVGADIDRMMATRMGHHHPG